MYINVRQRWKLDDCRMDLECQSPRDKMGNYASSMWHLTAVEKNELGRRVISPDWQWIAWFSRQSNVPGEAADDPIETRRSHCSRRPGRKLLGWWLMVEDEFLVLCRVYRLWTYLNYVTQGYPRIISSHISRCVLYHVWVCWTLQKGVVW